MSINFQKQVRVKNEYKDIILGYIANFNANHKNIKIVITGGAALEMLSNDISFETDDYDIKFIYFKTETNDPTIDDDELQNVYNKRLLFADRLTTKLNKELVDKNKNDSQFKRHEEIDTFLLDSRDSYGIRVSIMYRYYDNNSVVDAAIVDLTVYSSKYASFIGESKEGSSPSFMDHNGAYSRQGLIKNIIKDKNMIKVHENIYRTSFSYIIWDTVRMLNWCLDAMSEKFNRYARKYAVLLALLTDPGANMECLPEFREYCEKCEHGIKTKRRKISVL